MPLSRVKKVAFVVLAVAGAVVLWWVRGFFGNEIDVAGAGSVPTLTGEQAYVFPFAKDKLDLSEYVMPKEEKDRLDILVLGLRGKDDPDGGLLTDTMMMFSYNRASKRAALASIPRDLYVYIDNKRADKINAAYERLGLKGARQLVSKITGVYIDNAVVFDFEAFRKIVDTLGGVDVTLDKPFSETTQWGYAFSLPAGPNHLDGQQALYYARSRYSTSDFDRARRQQQIITAVKDKVGQSDLLSNPLSAVGFLNSIRSNIATDFNLTDIGTLIDLAKDLNGISGSLKRGVLSTENLLYQTQDPNEPYLLFPKGDSLEPIKTYFRTILSP